MQIPLFNIEGPQGKYPINCFYDIERENGRPGIIGTPGVSSFCDLGTSASVQCLYVVEDVFYAVSGGSLFSIDTDGSATTRGILEPDSEKGSVWIADNGIEIMLTAGNYGYIYTISTNTLAKITDADFPVPSSLAFQDGYFIITRKDTGEIYISGSYDGASWAALDYATAEGNPDYATSVLSDHRELWIFGTETIEPFYNSGDADFPFERIPGSFIEKGCGAAASISKADNSIFWLSDNWQVVRAIGYTPQIVSTRVLDEIIAKYTTKSDAIGYSYILNGYEFYVLTFPAADKTWAYNIATKLWHQWSSNGENKRHRSNCYALFGNNHLVGDYENGKIYKLDSAVYADDSDEIMMSLELPAIQKDRKTIFHHKFELDFKPGIGLITGQGSDPQAMLEWSDNDGKTWSNEHWCHNLVAILYAHVLSAAGKVNT